jgi:hypothetical protein
MALGHIAGLGSGRGRAGDHRLEHLGRRDHRFARFVGFPDDPFLKHRNLFGRHLHAEIAPGDHQPVSLLQDFLQVVNALAVLDLGDHRLVPTGFPDHVPDRSDIVGPADEGDGDQVHVEPDAVDDVQSILLGDRRQVDGDIGQTDPFPGEQRAADDDPGGYPVGLDPFDLHLQFAVVEQDDPAGRHIFVKALITDRDIVGSRRSCRENDQLILVELHTVSKFADPDFRSPGIEQNGRPGAQPFPGPFDGLDKVAVTFLVSV